MPGEMVLERLTTLSCADRGEARPGNEQYVVTPLTHRLTCCEELRGRLERVTSIAAEWPYNAAGMEDTGMSLMLASESFGLHGRRPGCWQDI